MKHRWYSNVTGGTCDRCKLQRRWEEHDGRMTWVYYLKGVVVAVKTEGAKEPPCGPRR